MTRETKIGLVVAGSFLCLVAIVVASKWKRGDGAPTDPEEQTVKVAAAKPDQNAGEGKPYDALQKKDASPSFPVMPTPERKAPPTTGGSPPLTSIPPPSPFGDPSREIPPPKPFEVKPSDVAIVPPPVQVEFKATTPTPFGQDTGSKPIATPFGQDSGSKPIVPVPVEDKKNDAPSFPPLAPPKKDAAPSFPPLAPPKKDAAPSFPPIDPSKPGSVEPLPKNPEKKEPPRPAINFGVVPVDEKKQEIGIPPLTNKEVPMVFPPAPKDGVPAIPLGPKKEAVPDFPPVPKDGLPAFPPEKKEANAPAVIPNPFDNTRPMNPIPPFNNAPSKPAVIPANPPDGPSTPPVGIGGARPTPTLNRYDPEFTKLQQGETSFGHLSQRLYGTPKYGDALHAYNRAHVSLIKDGPNLAANPPLLSPGQHVMYPPKELLERDYRTLIRETAAIPGTTVPPPAVRISPPAALNPGGGTAAPSPLKNTPGVYVVQSPEGERIRDIARRFLGNPDLWNEIYQLNPSVPPQFPIPAGTQLKLPRN